MAEYTTDPRNDLLFLPIHPLRERENERKTATAEDGE